MKCIIMNLEVFCVVALVGDPTFAYQLLLETVTKGVIRRSKTCCKDVMREEGRSLACLYEFCRAILRLGKRSTALISINAS